MIHGVLNIPFFGKSGIRFPVVGYNIVTRRIESLIKIISGMRVFAEQ